MIGLKIALLGIVAFFVGVVIFRIWGEPIDPHLNRMGLHGLQKQNTADHIGIGLVTLGAVMVIVGLVWGIIAF
jgi:hypothetical protein